MSKGIIVYASETTLDSGIFNTTPIVISKFAVPGDKIEVEYICGSTLLRTAASIPFTAIFTK